MADLPDRTEAERLTRVRIGQDLFRDHLMRLWSGRCPVTGIADPDLLRASHIKPWASCQSDAERLDPRNGLLLSALWDAAFDKGLVTFDPDGKAVASPLLSDAALGALSVEGAAIRLAPGQEAYLGWHRAHLFKS